MPNLTGVWGGFSVGNSLSEGIGRTNRQGGMQLLGGRNAIQVTGFVTCRRNFFSNEMREKTN